jgi:hypothetical protein
MNTPSIANQVREHRSLLASSEKLALVWMAERLPRWVGPDHLTVLGLLSRNRLLHRFDAKEVQVVVEGPDEDEWSVLSLRRCDRSRIFLPGHF